MKAIRYLILVLVLFVSNVSFSQFGTLDNTFGTVGKVITTFEGFDASVQSVLVQPDKKIVAGGNVSKNAKSQFSLARYKNDGSLDVTFGNLGLVIAVYPEQMVLSAIVLQSDGKIIAGGNLYNPTFSISHFVLLRFDSNGVLDGTFGTDGRVVTNFSDKLDRMTSLIVQSDDKIIASGATSDDISYSDFAMARYNSDGSEDLGFGNNGRTVTSLRVWDFGYAITLQDDNKIIVSGATSNEFNPDFGFNYDFAVLKYDKYGVLDSTFGSGGSITIGVPEANEKALCVKVAPDGKINIAGEHHILKYSIMLVQILNNGDLDTSFGTNGVVTTDLSNQFLESVAIQPDGKILATEYNSTGGCCGAEIKLIRLLANGNFDATFGTDGIVTTDFSNENSQANSIVIQEDGKIVIGGISGNQIQSNYGLARFNSELQLSNPMNQLVSNAFLVYPNPVNNTVNLDFNFGESGKVSVDLFDINGVLVAKLLSRTAFQSGFNSQTLQIPETLSKGVYFLTVSNGSKVSNFKLVK